VKVVTPMAALLDRRHQTSIVQCREQLELVLLSFVMIDKSVALYVAINAALPSRRRRLTFQRCRPRRTRKVVKTSPMDRGLRRVTTTFAPS
jgi:hypothetical protein